MTFFFNVEAKMKDQGEGKGTAELFFANTTIGFYVSVGYSIKREKLNQSSFTVI